MFQTVRRAIAETSERRGESFRVVHFAVRHDQVRLIVEASDKVALSAGVRGLTIAIAREVNRLERRKGKFWADRWRGRVLSTPGAVRDALLDLLAGDGKQRSLRARVDAFSSAPYFEGYAELQGRALIKVNPELVPRSLHPAGPSPVSAPESSLLASGWKRQGLLSLREAPRRPAVKGRPRRA